MLTSCVPVPVPGPVPSLSPSLPYRAGQGTHAQPCLYIASNRFLLLFSTLQLTAIIRDNEPPTKPSRLSVWPLHRKPRRRSVWGNASPAAWRGSAPTCARLQPQQMQRCCAGVGPALCHSRPVTQGAGAIELLWNRASTRSASGLSCSPCCPGLCVSRCGTTLPTSAGKSRLWAPS